VEDGSTSGSGRPDRALARAFGWFIILLALYVVYQNAGFRT